MLLIIFLGGPLAAISYICEHLVPAWRFHKHMQARRPRPHTFA